MHTFLNEPWLGWAIEIQSLAQCGLTYTKDPFDKERFERLREIAAEMLSHKAGIPVETVKTIFCNEAGYQTPKLDTRAAIVENGKILLVHEKNGTWSLPGGWVDVLESIGSNTVKEVQEEAGLTVCADRIIAVHDRNRHNEPPYAYGVCKVFVQCHIVSGSFQSNLETVGYAFFGADELPPLAEEKCNAEQVLLCLRAAKEENWQVEFD